MTTELSAERLAKIKALVAIPDYTPMGERPIGHGKLHDAILDLLDELRRREWRPIETAPKDGTKILLSVPGHGVGSGFWQHIWTGCCAGETEKVSGWRVHGMLLTGEHEGLQPTHWQPLPEPPHE